MAITAVVEIGGKAATTNEKNERTYTKIYRIESDKANEFESLVRDSVPWLLGQMHDVDNAAFALSASARQVSDDGHTWEAVVEFGPFPQQAVNPTLQPATEGWTFQQDTIPIDKDRDGKIIANSAGVPYTDGLEIQRGLPILTVTKNLPASFNPAFSFIFVNKINSNSFRGAPKGKVKVLDISSQEVIDPVFGQYWTVQFQFLFDPKGFDKVILDQGLREIDGNKLKAITDQGVPVSEPVAMDGSGGRLPQGGTPVFRTHKVFNQTNFNVFGV